MVCRVSPAHARLGGPTHGGASGGRPRGSYTGNHLFDVGSRRTCRLPNALREISARAKLVYPESCARLNLHKIWGVPPPASLGGAAPAAADDAAAFARESSPAGRDTSAVARAPPLPARGGRGEIGQRTPIGYFSIMLYDFFSKKVLYFFINCLLSCPAYFLLLFVHCFLLFCVLCRRKHNKKY